MSVKEEDVKKSDVRKVEGTIGGPTYFVILPNKAEEKPICFRPIFNQPEFRCTSPAGHNTSHNGEGACKRHGGADKHIPISHGKYAFATRHRLAGSIEKYLSLERTQLLDLTRELATLRAMYDEAMEHFPEPEAENYAVWFHRMTELIGSMGTLVEKISRTDSRNTLTAAQVLYFKACVVDVILKYVLDPGLRDRAVKELAVRLGGDTSGVLMKPSEYAR